MTNREELTKQFVSDIASKTDSLIEKGLPADYDPAKCHCDQYPGDVRVFSYDGKPFLELHPVEMRLEEGEHGVTKLVSTQRYRYLS
jgi:hypothetical protein